MAQPPQNPSVDVAGALAIVRSGGGRATPAKRLVLELLETHPGHITTEELTTLVQAREPDVAASTIYRILEEFVRLGIVEHSHAGKGAATYHLQTAAHGHLVCQQCGQMIEAPPELFSQLVRQAHETFGFAVDPHHFAVLGVCDACRRTA